VRGSRPTVPRETFVVNREPVAQVRCRVSPPPPQGGDQGPVYTLLLVLNAALPNTAQAAEVVWEGHYRTQVRYFDSLSLSESNENNEGTSLWADHRLRLQPSFIISDKVRLYTEFNVLPFVRWGDEAVVDTDLATGLSNPEVTSQTVQSPSAEDGSAGLQNLQVRRVWGQLDTKYAQFRFGRMPVEWGAGMIWNAGNDPLDEFGTTADRLQFTAPVGPVTLIGAYEIPYEGFVNQRFDVRQLSAGVAHLGENVGVGSYNTFRWQGHEGESKFSVFTGDVWAHAKLGQAEFEWELGFQMGGGDLSESINDVRLTGLGSVLNARVDGAKVRAGLGVGITTGDANPFDNEYRSFSFHPDYDIALMMFEEPMPVLAHENPHTYNNGGRDYGAVRLNEGIENAMFLRPSIGYRLRDDLVIDAALITARATKLQEELKDVRGYGTEVDFTIAYRPFEHFSLMSTTGYYMPGPYISEYTHDELGGGFDQAALGSRLLGTIEF